MTELLELRLPNPTVPQMEIAARTVFGASSLMCCLTIAGGAVAAELESAQQPAWRSWPAGERFALSAGLFFAAIDTDVSARSASDPVRASIDFERDLGLDDTPVRPIGAAVWRFAKRHKLGLAYYQLDRSGDAVSKAQISIGALEIEAGIPVQSFVDIEVAELFYSYSPVFGPQHELSLGVGLSLQDIDIGVIANDGIILQSTDLNVVAPLPTLKLGYAYAFNERLVGRLELGWLAVETDLSNSTEFDGSIWNGRVGMRYRIFNNVAVDASWALFQVNIDYIKRDLIGDLDYDYNGPLLGLSLLF